MLAAETFEVILLIVAAELMLTCDYSPKFAWPPAACDIADPVYDPLRTYGPPYIVSPPYEDAH